MVVFEERVQDGFAWFRIRAPDTHGGGKGRLGRLDERG